MYSLVLLDHDLRALYVLQPSDLASVEFTENLYEADEFTVEILDGGPEDHVWLKIHGNTQVVMRDGVEYEVADIDSDIYYATLTGTGAALFINDVERDTSSGSITLRGSCVGEIFKHRRCLPPEGESHDTITGPAEDRMIHLVDGNVGESADYFRRVRHLTTAASGNRGTSRTTAARYHELQTLLGEIGEAAGIGWRMALDGTSHLMTFTPIVGEDRSDEVFFDLDLSSAEAQSILRSRGAYKNYVFVAGGGTGAARQIVEVHVGNEIPGGTVERDDQTAEDWLDAELTDLKTDGDDLVLGDGGVEVTASTTSDGINVEWTEDRPPPETGYRISTLDTATLEYQPQASEITWESSSLTETGSYTSVYAVGYTDGSEVLSPSEGTVTVEVSHDDGDTWHEATNGGVVPELPEFMGDTDEILVRATLASTSSVIRLHSLYIMIDEEDDPHIPRGIFRREEYRDARDTESTDTLISRGEEALEREGSSHGRVDSIECTIDPLGPFRRGDHWDLGDIVLIRNERWGVRLSQRITSVTSRVSATGTVTLEAGFGRPWPTIADRPPMFVAFD